LNVDWGLGVVEKFRVIGFAAIGARRKGEDIWRLLEMRRWLGSRTRRWRKLEGDGILCCAVRLMGKCEFGDED
jgi:hypothetical protein